MWCKEDTQLRVAHRLQNFLTFSMLRTQLFTSSIALTRSQRFPPSEMKSLYGSITRRPVISFSYAKTAKFSSTAYLLLGILRKDICANSIPAPIYGYGRLPWWIFSIARLDGDFLNSTYVRLLPVVQSSDGSFTLPCTNPAILTTVAVVGISPRSFAAAEKWALEQKQARRKSQDALRLTATARVQQSTYLVSRDGPNGPTGP